MSVYKSTINILSCIRVCFAQNELLIASHTSGIAFEARGHRGCDRMIVWIHNYLLYLCNQYLSPLAYEFKSRSWGGVQLNVIKIKLTATI